MLDEPVYAKRREDVARVSVADPRQAPDHPERHPLAWRHGRKDALRAWTLDESRQASMEVAPRRDHPAYGTPGYVSWNVCFFSIGAHP